MKTTCTIFSLGILALVTLGQDSTPSVPGSSSNTIPTHVVGARRPAATQDLIVRGLGSQRDGQPEVALQFYRQAMLAGDAEGAYLAGRLAWDEAGQAQGRQQLLKHRTALDNFFRAATNLHAGACLKLAEACHAGDGVPLDRVQSYLWLKIARDIDPATPMDLLDQLAVRLTPAEIDQAQIAARQYLAGGWPEAFTTPLIEGDARLKLTGVTTGLRTTVMINHVTLQAGDSAVVPVIAPKPATGKAAPQTVGLRCLAIGSDYILLEIDGEREQRLLRLNGL